MRAYVIHEEGARSPHPRRGPGASGAPRRSLIRIRAFGLNHSEIFTRQGLSLLSPSRGSWA